MDKSNKNQKKNQHLKSLEQAAESWAKLCLYHLKQKKLSVNQNNNKKTYEYNTK